MKRFVAFFNDTVLPLAAFVFVAVVILVGAVGLVNWTVAAQAPSVLFVAAQTGAQPALNTALATYPASTTTTARNVIGALVAEKSSRFTVVSAPASGTVASASLAAEAGVRHVADCVGFSADASAAVAAAAGTFVVRDGATGAGTIIASIAVAHQVAAGAGIQTILPQQFCGLNLVGSTNTAMTAEFNAGVTGEVQAAYLTGYNVQ